DQKPEIATRDGLAFLSIQDNGSLVALDERTGEEKWSLTVEKSRIESGPSIDGTPFYWYDNLIPMATATVLYVREGDSALLAVDPDTGTELWRKTLLTREELANEVKNLCDVIPVNDGILVVTDDAMDMYPIVELWQ
ncbi:MAG: PQQ-binding-like beta-propeller repeat protein, partial [Candidatus Cryosericum sp.]